MIYRKVAVVFLALAVAGAVFAKDNLAILPFTGGTAEEGETIAELFSYSDELKAAWTLIPRTSITRAIGSEWKFQTDTGMTDPDTIMAIGKQLGAQYIVAGNIAKLGALNLLVISILKIDDLRQVAGDIQTYARIGDIRGKLPDMARNIVAAAGVDASRLDKLAVTPVQLRGNVDARVADTLAQVLSINLIRGGKYAVYPRTATLEQVQTEYDNQTDGMTADENIVGIGKGENLRFVLSVAAWRLDEQNMFNASIINLESGEQIVGRSVDYQTLEDGITVMQRLARELTATLISLPLAESLEWIANNAVEGGSYLITLKNNETIEPQSLSYGWNKVSIILDGGTVERIVRLSSNGSLFSVESGVTLTLGNNITLQGRRNNTYSLVYVNGEGTLEMESGSKISGNNGGGVYVGGTWTSEDEWIAGTFTMSGGAISGNSTSTYYDEYYDEYYSGSGGGVYVGGTFTMSGGTISGNTASTSGGGVFVWTSEYEEYVGGTFTKQAGGVIYGADASDTLKNTATGGDGHAVYVEIDESPGKKRNSTAGVGVRLDSTRNGSAGG